MVLNQDINLDNLITQTIRLNNLDNMLGTASYIYQTIINTFYSLVNNNSFNDNSADITILYKITPIKRKINKNKFLSHLPSYRRIKKGDNIIDIKCPICLDNFKVNQYKRKLPCCHIFHKKCVDKWLIKCPKVSCPMCRESFKKDDEEIENNFFNYIENNLRNIID